VLSSTARLRPTISEGGRASGLQRSTTRSVRVFMLRELSVSSEPPVCDYYEVLSNLRISCRRLLLKVDSVCSRVCSLSAAAVACSASLSRVAVLCVVRRAAVEHLLRVLSACVPCRRSLSSTDSA
jgi:hypothetical protein